MRANACTPWYATIPAALLLAAGASLAVPALASAPKEEAERADKKKPSVLAVKFYADWCGTCQVMKPAFEEAKGELAEEPVLFLVLDMTDRGAANQAEMHANVTGLEELWEENGGKTGTFYLVSTEDKEVVGTITPDMDAEQMKETITAAL